MHAVRGRGQPGRSSLSYVYLFLGASVSVAGYLRGKITHQWDLVVDLDLFHGGKLDLLQLSHWSRRLHCVLLVEGGGSELGTWPLVEGNWLEALHHLQSSEIPLPSAPPSTSCLERHLE